MPDKRNQMRFARLGDTGEEVPVIQQRGVSYDLRPLTDDIDGAFLAAGGLSTARQALGNGELSALQWASSARIGAPIARPGKVVCVGLNYFDHAAETGARLPAEPVIFMKDPSTIVGPNDSVEIPRGSSKTDWEIELAVIIGATARYLDSESDAAAVIAGYSISNDVSEREFQLERGGQWDKGKSCDTFNPLGPALVPVSEISDPQRLRMRLWVNGRLRQDSSTDKMIFGVHHIVWYLSQFMVLRPGDVINTGTPAGVALGQPDLPYLRTGDKLELEIDEIGRSTQTMVSAE